MYECIDSWLAMLLSAVCVWGTRWREIQACLAGVLPRGDGVFHQSILRVALEAKPVAQLQEFVLGRIDVSEQVEDEQLVVALGELGIDLARTRV